MDDRKDNPDLDLWRRITPVAPAGIGVCPSDMTVASYVDGRLTGDEIASMEAHLACCPACLEAVLSVRSLTLAQRGGSAWSMAEARAVAAAQSLVPGAEGVSFGSSAARHRRLGGWRMVRGGLAAAAMIAVSVLGYHLGHGLPGIPGRVSSGMVVSEASFGLLPDRGEAAPGAVFAVLQEDAVESDAARSQAPSRSPADRRNGAPR